MVKLRLSAAASSLSRAAGTASGTPSPLVRPDPSCREPWSVEEASTRSHRSPDEVETERFSGVHILEARTMAVLEAGNLTHPCIEVVEKSAGGLRERPIARCAPLRVHAGATRRRFYRDNVLRSCVAVVRPMPSVRSCRVHAANPSFAGWADVVLAVVVGLPRLMGASRALARR